DHQPQQPGTVKQPDSENPPVPAPGPDRPGHRVRPEPPEPAQIPRMQLHKCAVALPLSQHARNLVQPAGTRHAKDDRHAPITHHRAVRPHLVLRSAPPPAGALNHAPTERPAGCRIWGGSGCDDEVVLGGRRSCAGRDGDQAVVAPAGTCVTTVVAVREMIGAGVPLNATLVAPTRLKPEMVTCVPTGPDSGFLSVICGVTDVVICPMTLRSWANHG